MESQSEEVETLAGLVKSRGLTEAGFESLVLKLGPQESRLFQLLHDGPADTVRVRTACSIGNPSQVRNDLNAKLAAAGDPRRVVCQVVAHINRFGNRGQLGLWRLVNAKAANDEGAA